MTAAAAPEGPEDAPDAPTAGGEEAEAISVDGETMPEEIAEISFEDAEAAAALVEAGDAGDAESETLGDISDPLLAFEQSQTASGVTVTVRAEAGAFPEGATLSVKAVPVEQEVLADAAIEDAREDEQTVVTSHALDISILDPEGHELQPAEGFSVTVSFALAEAADESLEACVYHMSEDGGEMTAEALDIVEATGDTVTAMTGGFSIFVVQTVAQANAVTPWSVDYVDAKGKDMGSQPCLPAAQTMTTGWYDVFKEDVFNERIEIQGDVNLILCNESKLRANAGIYVPVGSSLTIWVQCHDWRQGSLVAINKRHERREGLPCGHRRQFHAGWRKYHHQRRQYPGQRQPVDAGVL